MNERQVPSLLQIDLPFDRYELEFVRHPRARRYIIRVGHDGVVRVTIPRGGSKREAEAFAAHERAWIEKQLERMRRPFDSSGSLRAFDSDVRGPAMSEAAERPSRMDDTENKERERAKRELPVRLLELAGLHGFATGAIRKISVRNQKWRWGSCSRSGHICLNWRLVTMPDVLRDYVLIHELMHLKRMDHSPKFWKLVAQACPDFRELRRRLRQISYRA